MAVLHRSFFSIKTVFRYSPIWSILLIGLVFASSLFTPLQVLFLERLVDSVATGLSAIIITRYGILLILAIAIRNAFSLSSNFLYTKITNDLNRKQIPITLQKFQDMEYGCFESVDSQDILQKISSNPQSDVLSVFQSIISILFAIISVVGIIILFFRASLPLGIVSIVVMTPVFILESVASHKEMKLRWTMTTDIRKRYYLQQLFVDKNSLQELKLFNAAESILHKCDILTQRINNDTKNVMNRAIALSTLASVCLLLFVSCTLWILSTGLVQSTISIGAFVSLLTTLGTFFGQVQSSVSVVSSFIRLSYSIQYYLDFLSLPNQHRGKLVLSKGNHTVCFEHVSFHYPNSDNLVLRDITFSFTTNERIAFVGKNGAGKTTIIKLLLGLYEPTDGSITVDGIHLSELSNDTLRSLFTVVFQDYQNYQLSLRDNIAFGCIEYLHNDQKLMEALHQAGIDELADDPNGLDRYFGQIQEEGTDLSGGQWQRLAIARAFLSDADFIILDEPTAALDPIAESNMYESFSNVMQDRGAIIISHRLASAKMAEKIYVILNGMMIECGSHDELMSEKGYYAEMFQRQSSWYVS